MINIKYTNGIEYDNGGGKQNYGENSMALRKCLGVTSLGN